MEVKKHYKFIFVVLVYRNTSDLKSFFVSNRIKDSRTVVVVSHYDEKTDKQFKDIAFDNDADVIFIPNKGYGFGNNKGIEFSIENFSFEYLIVSNADIEIRQFDEDVLKKYSDNIIAPCIIASSGRLQNPGEPFKPSHLVHNLAYKAYKGDHYKLIWLYYGWCRVKRILYNVLEKLKIASSSIYAAHGSFIIFPYNTLMSLIPLFNEKMFLMNEEAHLAKKAKLSNITTKYVKDIVIDHKEDGSMSLEYKNEFPLLKQSFIEFYLYWYK